MALVGPHPEDPDRAARADEGDVERGRPRERRGAEPGQLAVGIDPLGDRQLCRVDGQGGGGNHTVPQAPPRFREEDCDFGGKDLEDVLDGDGEEALRVTRVGQLPAHGIEGGRPPLALARRESLDPRPDGEPTDHQGNHEHDAERDQVLRVGDGEGEIRRHEEEIERGDAEHRSEHGGATAASHRHDHHAQEIQHDQVRQPHVREHAPGHGRAEGDDAERFRIRQRIAGLEPLAVRPGNWRLLVPADHVDVDVAAAAHESVRDRAEEHALPQRSHRLADHDLADVPGPRVGEDLLAHGGSGEGGRLRPELLGQAQGLHDAVPIGLRQAGARRRLHVRDDPFGPEPGGQTATGAHELSGRRTRADADEDTLGHRPRLGDGVVAHVGLHLRVHALRGAPKGELSQRDQIALAEKAPHGFSRLLGEIDLALLQAMDQLVRRQVDQLDLVGPVEHQVRDGLAHDHARDLGHEVVEALEVLHVDGRVDVDACVEELQHVLPALGVARALGVGVGQLVDENVRGTSGEGGVEVELLEGGAAVGGEARWEDFETVEERFGLRPAVGLDIAHDHVHACRLELARGFEHGEGLADARRRAEEELETALRLARLFLLGAGKQSLGVRPVLGHARSPSVHGAASVPKGQPRGSSLKEAVVELSATVWTGWGPWELIKTSRSSRWRG